MPLKFLSSPQLWILNESASAKSVAAARPVRNPPSFKSKFQGESRPRLPPFSVMSL